jgi:hypothetical protein
MATTRLEAIAVMEADLEECARLLEACHGELAVERAKGLEPRTDTIAVLRAALCLQTSGVEILDRFRSMSDREYELSAVAA